MGVVHVWLYNVLTQLSKIVRYHAACKLFLVFVISVNFDVHRKSDSNMYNVIRVDGYVSAGKLKRYFKYEKRTDSL